MPATTAPLGRRLSWLPTSQSNRRVPIEDAASRIAAFVYGDILVLTALLAESVGARVRTDQRLTAAQLRHELRDCLRVQRASARTFLSGVLLALAGIGAAALKWWLTR